MVNQGNFKTRNRVSENGSAETRDHTGVLNALETRVYHFTRNTLFLCFN